MKQNKINFLIVLGVLLLVGGILFVKSNSLIASVEDSIFIGERSTLYVKEGCPNCEKQKSLFGENIKYLNVVECSENLELCYEKGINIIPTWEIDENKYSGFKSISQLKDLISKNYVKDIYGNISIVPNSSIGKSCPLFFDCNFCFYLFTFD